MIKKYLELGTLLFPVWAVFFSILAYTNPDPWIDLKHLILPLLGIVMFSMGLTLEIKDFHRVFKNVKIVFLGVLLQFFFMPLIGFFLISIFQLKEMLAIGLLLVGCSPGGTASNVICYLAKGDVALSISVTTCSTLLSVFLTPLLFLFYTGNTIETPVIDMMVTITKIVLIPVGLGMLLNNFNVSLIKKIKIYLPLIAVFSIVFIIAIIIGSNANQITRYGFGIFSVVVLHNVLGFFSGYYSSYFLGLNKITCKTLAIEIAMQNSGLATALAFKYFGILSSLPGAIFSIFHNISGSVIATYWQKNPNN